MTIPPGLVYLSGLFQYYTPSVLLCFGFKTFQQYDSALRGIPSWLLVLVTVVARPLFGFASLYWGDYVHARAARANGAIQPPAVQEATISLLNRMAETTKHGYPAEMMLGLSKIYGYAFLLDLRPLPGAFVTMEPDHIKAILATQFDSFPKGNLFIQQMNSLLGTGVFNSDGEMWKFHRSITRPFFVRERISDFEIYERNADYALAQAKERLADGISVDFQDLTARFTLDSAAEFLFGANVNSISAGLPFPSAMTSRNPKSFYDHPSTPFVNAFGRAQVLSLVRLGYGPAWPLWEFWGDQVKPLRRVVDEFVTPLMNDALEKRAVDMKAGIKPTEEESNVLAHLVRDTQDPQIIKDELFNLLVAGRDTTSSLLTFSFYVLTQHPDIEKRLRDEIFKFVGPTAVPDYCHMRDMKYMRAFLNEVLRMYPPVPSDSRCTNKAVVLPATSTGMKPIYLPADTTCIYSTMNMHRRTDLWGPDALTFDPDRFLDERLHKYLFAYHEATFFLVRLLQQYTGFKLDDSLNATPPTEWQTRDEYMQKEKIHPMAHLTMYVKDGLWVKMEELKSN
ncbi:hypothetical protein D9619_009315 [Psilocybe cf. subviscida]|uniref:Cytochrome P450 n=1 Tax=Psilocybe cf. subviscida TaxID=2480587 RepID=A0A8H5BVN6_9AGAR|nr:hypothetical protein D9619_009315 [Psilocybe cf. subviscida]